MTKPLSLWERVLFFMGQPRMANPKKHECFQCKSKFSLIDLGDGDIICEECWRKWTPSYNE